MAPEAVARRLTALVLCGCITIACSRGTADVTVSWDIQPTPPVAGAVTIVRVTLQHQDGRAVRGATLKIEGHMSHPGMTPVVADASERDNGAYEARISLSMAGDWVFVLTGELADRRRITRNISVSSVRPAG